jgi:hypothetical protein
MVFGVYVDLCTGVDFREHNLKTASFLTPGWGKPEVGKPSSRKQPCPMTWLSTGPRKLQVFLWFVGFDRDVRLDMSTRSVFGDVKVRRTDGYRTF